MTDPEHGEAREQLIDGVGLHEHGRLGDKLRLHAIGHSLAGCVKHFHGRTAFNRAGGELQSPPPNRPATQYR